MFQAKAIWASVAAIDTWIARSSSILELLDSFHDVSVFKLCNICFHQIICLSIISNRIEFKVGRTQNGPLFFMAAKLASCRLFLKFAL